jgi:hypothetical protein
MLTVRRREGEGGKTAVVDVAMAAGDKERARH